METTRLKSKRIMAAILSIVMVLSSLSVMPARQRYVFAAPGDGGKYIFEYDGETATSALDGFSLATQMGKTNALKFDSKGKDVTIVDVDAISTGTAVFEIELLPASGSQELVKIYNSAGDLLLEITNKINKIVVTDGDGNEGKNIADIVAVDSSDGKNVWSKVRVEIYFDEIVTNDAGNRVLQYQISAMHAANKNTYSETYEGWIEAEPITQDDSVNKDAEKWANGTANQTIDGSADHPFDIKTITVRSNSNARWIGDIRLYHIPSADAAKLTEVAVTKEPDTTEYVPGATALDLTGLVLTETYSDGSTVELSDLATIEKEYDIEGFDATLAGTKTITVTSKVDDTVYTSFDITVKDVTLSSIAVTAPYKTTYLAGATELNLAGLVVEGTYSDGSVAELTDEEYVVSTPDLSTEGEKNVTVTAVADDTATASFEVDVTVANDVFVYDDTVGAAEDMGVDVSDGASFTIDTETTVAGNDSQKLKVAAGYATKDLGDITSGIVKFETEFNRSDKSAFFTVRDAEGNALVTIGQFSRTNLYGVLDAAYNTSGLPFEILVDGSGNNWIRLETEIDLDASNNAGVLQFATKIYTKSDYTADYTYQTTVTEAVYQSTTFGNANGCATAGLTSFSVGSVEYATQASNADGAYFDNLYIGATASSTVIEPVTLEGVAVTTAPDTTEYDLGATELDLTGLVLTETYSDGSTDELDADTVKAAYDIAGFDTSAAGIVTITLTNKSDSAITTTFDITVKEKVVSLASIAVDTAPAKTDYVVGETVDLTGLVVTGTYSDTSVKTLIADEYTVNVPELTAEGKVTVTITAVADSNITTSFEVNVTAATVVTKDVYDIFVYDDDVEAVDDLGLITSSGANQAVDTSSVKGHTTQKLKVSNGYASKDWGYDITTGIVKFETEFNRNGKSAFFTVRDKDGNAVFTIGQFSRTNLYAALDDGYNTSGEPFEILIDGSSDNWIRLEIEIDLDKSNSTGVLEFTADIYAKSSYTDEWTYKTSATAANYQGETFGNANGSATSTLTSFSVSSVEYATRASDGTAYFDNLYVGASDALSNVEVKTLPDKTEYALGASTLELAGLVLTETYGANTVDVSDLAAIEENYVVSGFDTSTVGTKTITITSKSDASVKATFEIEILNLTIEKIEITTAPNKTDYFVGDTEVDATGMVVTGTYSDNSTVVLSAADYTVGALDSAVAGKAVVTVTAVAKNAAGEAVTATFEVTVKTPVVTGIQVAATPVKTQYLVNAAADWSGLVVKALYDNGSSKELALSELAIAGFDSSAVVDSQIITVTYGEFTATFEIKVVDASTFEAVEFNFDFNIEGSSTADGWTGIFVNKSKGTKYGIADYGYTAEKGYGINTTVTDLQGRNEKAVSNPAYTLIPEAAWKDFVLLGNANGSFDVDLPNGTYNVQVIVGTTNPNTTAVKIENNDAYTGSVTISSSDNPKMFKVIEIPNVVVSDGQMNIVTTADSIARTSAIIISNVAAPTGTTAVLETEGEIAVSVAWGVTLGATGYNVYRTHNGVTELVGTVDGIGTTTFKDSNVDCLETYTYFVRGISANGLETIASTVASVVVMDSSMAAPATPENFKISAMDTAATTLTWGAVDNASYYEVYAIAKTAEDVNNISGYTLIAKVADTSYVCDIEGHADMYFKVVAAGLGGKSVATDVAFSDAAAPAVPANLKVSEITDDATTLTWDASANAVYYEVYWSDRNRSDLTGTNGYELIGTSSTNSFVYELPTHVVRYYKVVAVGAGGRSEASESVQADIVKKFDVQAEYLDRGLVAIAIDNGVYVGWRLLGDEYAANASYKLYRDGVVIRTFDATENTSFLDVDGTADSKYAVSVVIDGEESEKCAEVAVQSTDYLEVPIQAPEAYYDDKLTKDHIKSTYYSDTSSCENIVTDEQKASGEYTYAANDTYVGDVDGDGVYEIIVKWNGMSRDNSQDGYTSPVYIDCYKLDGTLLWRINLGINIRAGAHYTQPVVADLDGDGKAEIMMRTADGTVDGTGVVIGNATADYRNEKGHIITGPDFLTLFDGETGKALDTINYVPQRGSASLWGDNYGGRSERFLSGAAYLDGENIYAIFARGYYTRAVVAAFYVENDEIKEYWVCDSNDAANSALYGQGAHSFTVADVDGDGCQEIVYGAATIDNDGTVMYGLSDLHGSSYGKHGDAERVTDMNLLNPGLEIFMVHEDKTSDSMEMHDALTGEYIYYVGAAQDVGRGAAGDIDPRYEGVETWSTIKDENGVVLAGLRDANGNIVGKRPSPVNHMAWFDGNMGREFVDNSDSVPYVGTWDYENEKVISTLLEGCKTNNTTKANAAFQADMFGDWREELAFRTEDNTAIRIYTSTETMDYRLYTLMHDPTYRAQMACNGSAYNQSPDAGFYIGYDEDLMVVPVPTLNVVKALTADEIKVESIEVTAPDKVTYLVGEELDLAGMVVTAIKNDNSKVVLTESEYVVDSSKFDSSVAAEGIVITVTYGNFSDSFTVKVVNAEDRQSFYYLDDSSIDSLGFTVTDGGSITVTDTAQKNNTTNKLAVSAGTAVKKFEKAISSGKVTFESVSYQNGNTIAVRVVDADGNSLINVAHYNSGNYNLYRNKDMTGSPYKNLIDKGVAKNKWIKNVIEIDLDKSNETGVLHFTMSLYYKNNYDDADWTAAGVFTQDNTYKGSEFNHANGAATNGITSFKVGGVEFQSDKTSYVDDIFFDDGTGIGEIVTSTRTLKSVEITKPAAVTQFSVGSVLNTAGLEITGTYEITYSDGRTPEIKTTVISKYETEYDFSQVVDETVVKIIVKDGENVFTKEYTVKVVPKSDGSYEMFEYIDEDSAAVIGFTGSSLSVTNNDIEANDESNRTNRITVGKGTATKVFDTPFTTGTVHFETAFMTMATSKASLFIRMKNSEGDTLIDVAQYGSSNLNLYIDEQTSGTDGAMAARFADFPVKNWAKLAVDIDLDATAKAGHLVFDAVVWTTDDYESGNWTKFAEFDENVYLNSETASTTTGSASSDATVFDIASIELYNAAGSTNYYDDMYFEAIGEGTTKELVDITVVSEPTKKTYVEGDNFNAAGLEIMGTYKYTFKDGTTTTKQREITIYDVEFNNRVIGDSVPVVISVGDLSVTFNVKVTKSAALDDIESYIVDYINNDLVTLLDGGIIGLNKRQVRLPYSNVDGVKLDWTAVSSNVTVSDRIMTVTPSTEGITEAVITVSMFTKNADGSDVTVKKDITFEVAKASSDSVPSISFESLEDYQNAIEAMMDMGIFEGQVRLNDVTAILDALEGGITVEEFVAILVNLFDIDTTHTETKIDRNDIDYDAWYADYVIAAFQLSIETEESRTGKERYGIGDSLTKEDIIYMLSRIVAVDKTTLPSDYLSKIFE